MKDEPVSHKDISDVFRSMIKTKRDRGTLSPMLDEIIKSGKFYLEANMDDPEDPTFISVHLITKTKGTFVKFIGFTKKHPKDKQNILVGLTRALHRMFDSKPQYHDPGLV